MTDLQYFLDQQSELQRKMPTPHPIDLFLQAVEGPEDGFADQEPTDEDREPLINFLQWNNKALIHEIVEEEAETGWKPWATSKHVNIEAARGEWIDQFHFMLNKALALGMNAEMIQQLYDSKHDKNAKRQAEGYDGVSTKCPGCGRALDDAAVNCTLIGENEIRRQFHCAIKGDIFLIKEEVVREILS